MTGLAERRIVLETADVSRDPQTGDAASALIMGYSRWFERLPTWFRVGLYALLTAVTALSLGKNRGPVIGVAAGLFYGAMFVGYASAPSRVRAWSRRHVHWDAALFVPISFFALLALLPEVDIWISAVLAVGVGGPIALLTANRRRRLRARETGERQV